MSLSITLPLSPPPPFCPDRTCLQACLQERRGSSGAVRGTLGGRWPAAALSSARNRRKATRIGLPPSSLFPPPPSLPLPPHTLTVHAPPESEKGGRGIGEVQVAYVADSAEAHHVPQEWGGGRAAWWRRRLAGVRCCWWDGERRVYG